MEKYRRWLARPAGEVRRFEDVDRERADRVLEEAAREGRLLLPVPQALEVLEAYGIPVAPYRVVGSAEEAARAADELGYPVVLKAVAPGLSHKSEAGAVALDLDEPEAVRVAYREMKSAAAGWPDGAEMTGAVVQPMVRGGRETIVGMTLEPNFGPLIMFGLGGVYVEALGDVTFRVQPVADVDAREMVRDIRGARLLEGVRGEPGVCFERLAEVLERVSQLVGDHPEIRELDVNPFLAFREPERCVAVDARILVGEPVEDA
jgi:acyl-CoA synthetase (NDP forming)